MNPKKKFLTIKEASHEYYVNPDILETLIKQQDIKMAYKEQIGTRPEKAYYLREDICEVLKYLTVDVL